jgi:hypothetical protein
MTEAIRSVIISLIIAACGSLVTRGYLTSDQVQYLATTLGAAAVGIGSIVYIAWKRRNAGLIKDVAKIQEVQKVVVSDQALADAIPRAEVVGPKDEKTKK